MDRNDNSLGKELGLLRKIMNANGSSTNDKKPNEIGNTTLQLLTLLNNLNSEKRSELFSSIPGPCCSNQKTFLKKNEEFFLAFFFAGKEDASCEKLFVHLNNCIYCAEIFAEVLKEYSLNSNTNSD